MLYQLLPALSYLHGNNLLHRDIKPANILCADDGTPILIDFGTARALVSERSQTMVESAGYTPLEQIQSHGNTGPWTDLYALGATCYKLITGETPPRSTDRVGEKDSYVPLDGRRELQERFSPVFLAGIDKAMALWPKQRWQNADEWLRVMQGKQPFCVAPGETSRPHGGKNPVETPLTVPPRDEEGGQIAGPPACSSCERTLEFGLGNGVLP